MGYNFNNEVHAHTLDGAPLYGTSTVVKEVMPPFLAKWGAQCAADFIESEVKKIAQSNDSVGWIKEFGDKWGEILRAAPLAWTKVRKDAATKGTDMHKDLEDYVQLCIEKFGGTPQVGESFTGKIGAFAEWANSNVETFIFSEKHTYSKGLWVGGVVDCLAKLRTGELAVIDFKSSPVAYFNQFVQAAGYALQLEESGYCEADGSNPSTKVKIDALIVVPFGSKTLKPEKIINVKGFQESFRQIVEVYKLLQAFKNR